MDIHNLMSKDFPLVYDLSVTPDTLQLSVSPHVADAVETILIAHIRTADQVQSEKMTFAQRVWKRINELEQNLELPKFVLPFCSKWGFGGVIKNEEYFGSNKPVVWSFIFPKRSTVSGFHDDEFFSRHYYISATLQILFLILHHIDVRDNESKQLVMIDSLRSDKRVEGYGASLSVTMSKVFCEWLAGQDQDTVKKIETVMRHAMKKAYERIGSLRFISLQDFSFPIRMNVGSKLIYISCPGNACGLSPDDRADDDTVEGYQLAPHNTDSPIQQLTLLCGIAAAAQFARENGCV